MRQFTPEEEAKIRLLVNHSVKMAYLEPTLTGLKKSIMDATAPVRHYLEEEKIHNYRMQKQGPKNKKIVRAFILTEREIFKTKASLYRPVTKRGDPRIWIYSLNNFTQPNDIITIIAYRDELYVFNLTKVNVGRALMAKEGPFYELVKEINKIKSVVSEELLGKLRKIAKDGPIKSIIPTDTGVGRTLEKALHIPMNPYKAPDYKGIEIKSFRDQRSNRKTLFAQVPDWSISKFKNSGEILNAFGYSRGGTLKLYCTVSAIKRNSQGLLLHVDEEIHRLYENSEIEEIGDFVAWKIEKLHKRLSEKHRETFWIKARSTRRGGDEFFNYRVVEHTKNPVVSQFVPLINQGHITLDHLIKRKRSGGAREKGPLFKLRSSAMSLLFPRSRTYSLKSLK